VFPYYSPAPEAQYPVQFDQSFGVLEWTLKNGKQLGLKTDRYVCAGDSVGGVYIVKTEMQLFIL
jgi:acetyl esterase